MLLPVPGCSGGMGGGSGAFALQQPCNGRMGSAPFRVSSSGGLDSSLSSPRPGSPASAELYGARCLLSDQVLCSMGVTARVYLRNTR